jgi:hypothetical protein
MSNNTKKTVKVGTPALKIAYCHINEPDTGGTYSDDKFKATVMIPKEHPWIEKEFRPAIAKVMALNGIKKMPDGYHIPITDGDTKVRTETNDEGVETQVKPFEGYYLLPFKSDFKPTVVDSRGNELPEDVKIFSGDTIRVGANMAHYTMNSGGITMYLNAVRLIEKNNTAGDPNQYFGEEEDADGYVYGGPSNAPKSVGSDDKSGPAPSADSMGIKF